MEKGADARLEARIESGAEAGGEGGAETRWRAGSKNMSLSDASSRRIPAWKARDGVSRCVFEKAWRQYAETATGPAECRRKALGCPLEASRRVKPATSLGEPRRVGSWALRRA
jgi:hypothetical protein